MNRNGFTTEDAEVAENIEDASLQPQLFSDEISPNATKQNIISTLSPTNGDEQYR